MITSANIFWITRLDSFGMFLGFISMITFIASVVIFFAAFEKAENDTLFVSRFMQKYISFKTCIACFMLFLFVTIGNCMLPTTKEMAAIIVIPKVANNEKIQELGDGIYQLANDWLKEISPNKKSNKKSNN